MKHLLDFRLFENIDDILDRMNRGEEISDIELKERGIDPDKFPKKNLTNKVVVKISGDKSPLLDESTPQHIVNKIFDVYFKGCDIVDGFEARQNWTCEGDDCKMPESIKWIVAYRYESETKKYPTSNMTNEFYSTNFGISHNLETGEKNIWGDKILMLQRSQFPDWEWDDNGWFEESYFYIPLGWSEYMTFKEQNQKIYETFGEYFIQWVCKKFQLKPTEWELNTSSSGTDRFRTLAKGLLGKLDYNPTLSKKFKPGKIIGKL